MSEYTHAIHSYPAMMMPRIARNVIQEYATSESIVLDPYMGSGTTLLEGMVENVGKVIGFDLNPLAVLISTAKTTKFNLEKIKKEIDNLDYHLSVLSNYEHPSFTILESWFKQENIDELARLKQENIDELARLKAVINNIEDSDVRLFFSVVFSETVRHVSFTRNGEFKLYKIPESKRDSHNPDAIAIFSQKLQSVYTTVKDFYENTTFLNSQTDVSIMNAAITDSDVKPNSIDLVVTSPPYGDSNTTVAYGQFSRLANEWLDFPEPISLDRRLMGGVKAKEIVKFDIAELDDAISMINEKEKLEKNKRVPSVVSFYKDYEESIEKVAEVVKHGGVVAYLVGNRRVRDVELQTDIITAKMFEKFGFTHEKTIVRDILNKRMPSKTSPTNNRGQKVKTMAHEYLVILRKNK